MYTHIHHVYTSTQYHYLVLNPTLSDIKIITFFCVFEGYNFSCTFNLAVSLYLSQISFQQHILDSYFFNPFKKILTSMMLHAPGLPLTLLAILSLSPSLSPPPLLD